MARILIIEGMAIIRDPLAAAMRVAGYETDETSDAATGLAHARANRPDIILVEIATDKGDGLQFLQTLRNNTVLGGIPVVVLTSRADRQMIARAAQLGVKDYLLKSRCSLNEILARVKKYIGGPLPAAGAIKPQPSLLSSVTDWAEVPRLLSREKCLARVQHALEGRALSGVVAEVLALASSPRSELSDLASLIGRDPSLSARILQTANSAAFNHSHKMVSTIQDSVRHLGVSNVRNIAMALGIFGAIPPGKQDEFNPIRSWQHSFATAMMCEQLAINGHGQESGVEYLVGLCHDLGQILFRTEFGGEYEQVLQMQGRTGRPLHQVEQHMLGIGQMQLIKVILKDLGLPESIRLPLEEFQTLKERPGKQTSHRIVRLLRFADLYANGMLVAASPASEVGSFTRAECRAVVGNDDPLSPDAKELTSQILALTTLLARLPAAEEAKLVRPILPHCGLHVGLVRDPAVSTFDPLAAALGSLADVEILSWAASKSELRSCESVIVVGPCEKFHADALQVPVLRIGLEGCSPDSQANAASTVSLQKLSDFVARAKCAARTAA